MKNSKREMDEIERFGFDFLGVVILAFLVLQLYFFVGFIAISLRDWL